MRSILFETGRAKFVPVVAEVTSGTLFTVQSYGDNYLKRKLPVHTEVLTRVRRTVPD